LGASVATNRGAPLHAILVAPAPSRQRAKQGETIWFRAVPYLPGPGWVDFDPASGIVGNRGLVRVAVVRDPRQAIPLHGTWTGFPSDNLGMTVEVNVTARRAGSDGS